MDTKNTSPATQAASGRKRPRRRLTIEERMAELEAKSQRAKTVDEKRQAKLEEMRSTLLSRKRAAFDKILSEHGIQSESQLRAAMELLGILGARGIADRSQLEAMLAREAPGTMLLEYGIQTASQLKIAMELHRLLGTAGITTTTHLSLFLDLYRLLIHRGITKKEQLEKALEDAVKAKPPLAAESTAQRQQGKIVP